MGIALVALAARIAAIEALRGATIAGSIVVDTTAELPPSQDDAARCAIVVASDRCDGRIATLQLTLSVFQRLLGPDERVGWYTPVPSEAAERALDVLASQVEETLARGSSDWAKAFRACIAAGAMEFDLLRIDGAAQRAMTVRFQMASDVPPAVLAELDAEAMMAGTAADRAARLHHLLGALSGKAATLADLGVPCGLTLAEAEKVEDELEAEAEERELRERMAGESKAAA